MKFSATITAVGALALLAGCNGSAANNSAQASGASTANTAAPATPAAPGAGGAAAGGTVDQAFLLGHWGRDGDCSRTVSFTADGTASATGQGNARWTLEGNRLTTTTPGDPPESVTVARNGDALQVSGPQNQEPRLNFTRCASAAAAPVGAMAPGAAGDAGNSSSD